jgi:hypothetical protein
MELCDAITANEDAIVTVDDLVEIQGVLTTANATVTRKVAIVKIPTAATALQDAKQLLNHKLNRKRVDSDDEEEKPVKATDIDEDDEESLTETSEDSDDEENETDDDSSE